MAFEFKTINDAACCLLGESVSIINQFAADYVIIGGWSPYLRYNSGKIHPGTKDVDVLFHNANNVDAIKDIIIGFLERGFLLSAKHDFQLIKLYNVSGREFAFNVDVLHPTKSAIKIEDDMFVKHLDVEVPISSLRSDTYKFKSIVQPEAECIFSETMHDNFDLNYTNSNGQNENVQFELLNDIGCLFSKSTSCQNSKRHRDSFDIYLSITNNDNYDGLIKKILKLKTSESSAFNSLIALKAFFEKDDKMYYNTKKYLGRLELSEFRCEMEKFFHDAGI